MFIAGMVILVARFVPEFDATFFQTVPQPINGFSRLFAPELHQILLDMATSVLRSHRDEVKLVNLRAPLLLVARINSTQVFTNASAHREAINTNHLATSFSSGGYGEHTARTTPHDENVGVVRGNNIFFSDFRGFAEPVAVILFFILGDDFNGDFATSLSDTLGSGLMNSARRNGGTKDAINFSALKTHQLLLQGFGSSLANRRSFVGHIQHHVRDFVFIKRHRDGHVTNTSGLSGISPRLINTTSSVNERRGGQSRTTD